MFVSTSLLWRCDIGFILVEKLVKTWIVRKSVYIYFSVQERNPDDWFCMYFDNDNDNDHDLFYCCYFFSVLYFFFLIFVNCWSVWPACVFIIHRLYPHIILNNLKNSIYLFIIVSDFYTFLIDCLLCEKRKLCRKSIKYFFLFCFKSTFSLMRKYEEVLPRMWI